MKPDDPRRALAVDALLAAAMFGLSIGSVVVWQTDLDNGVKPLDLWGYALMGGQTLPLLWRRRAPVTVLFITIGAFMIDRAINYPPSWAFFGISVAIYTIGAQLPPKRSLLIGGLTLDIVLLWTLLGVFVTDVEPWALVSEIAVLGLPLLLGRETYHRQQRLVELERRALRAEHEREQQAAEAVNQERVRIARELHDVVAHEITVMTIQSAAAKRVIATDREQAVTAMESAENAGHRALTEIRRLLGMLRTTDPSTKDPQPGMGSLHELVEQMNQAGLPTTLSVRGAPRTLPLGVDLNAYRIIQESLTNTLKHGGPGAEAEIEVAYGPESLSIEVNDDGRGAAAAPHAENAPGQGLVGMQERAALLDGSVRAGPRPGGGYRVTAKIPIPTA